MFNAPAGRRRFQLLACSARKINLRPTLATTSRVTSYSEQAPLGLGRVRSSLRVSNSLMITSSESRIT